MSDCVHKETSLHFAEDGQKWNVCKNCGTFMQDHERGLWKRIEQQAAEIAALQKKLVDARLGRTPRDMSGTEFGAPHLKEE